MLELFVQRLNEQTGLNLTIEENTVRMVDENGIDRLILENAGTGDAVFLIAVIGPTPCANQGMIAQALLQLNADSDALSDCKIALDVNKSNYLLIEKIRQLPDDCNRLVEERLALAKMVGDGLSEITESGNVTSAPGIQV